MLRCVNQLLRLADMQSPMYILTFITFLTILCLIVFSTSVVYYLGRCLFILRWMFASGAMKPAQLQLVLVGVKTAAQALKELALGVHLKPFLEEQMLEVLTDLVEPAQFFIGNLGSKQPDLEFALLQLQRHASLAVLDYLRCHMSMMVRSCGLGNGEGEGPDPNDGLLADSGESLSNVAVAAQLALRQSKEKVRVNVCILT
jgi:hypothetical protein